MSNELNELNGLSADLAEHDTRDSAVVTFTPGQIIGGKYKVLSLLGRGGVGSVYLVEQVFLKQELALKVLDGKQILDDAQVRRFQMEAKAAHSLNHANLVKVHDFGVLENEQPYLVMEYIKGVNLTEFIKANGPLKPQLATILFAQLCLGMAHAHQKSIIHRDIKPSNIMLAEDAMPGAPGSAKIVDFGIAKLAFDEGGEIQSLTRTGEIFGSPLYMSPEQCAGGVIDHRSDIYSFGCAMFEALTGTPPHLGTNPLRTMMLHVNDPAPMLREASLGSQFPDALERIVQKLLKKLPNERYQNFDDVAQDLTDVYSQDVVAQSKKNVQVVKQDKTLTISVRRLSVYICVALIASSAVTATVINGAGIFMAGRKSPAQNQDNESSKSFKNQPLVVESVPEIPDTAFENAVDSDTAARNAFSKVKRISSVISTDGEYAKQRRFDFPEVPMGYVIYTNLKRLARGTQYLPAGIPLRLNIGGSAKDAFNHPEIFHKLNPNEFTALMIWPPATTQVVGREKISVKDEAAKLADIVSAFSKSETVKAVSIQGLMVNRDTLASLGQMRQLQYLGVFDASEVEMGEVKQPVFQRVTELLVVNVAKSNQFWRQFYGSKHLNSLTLRYCKDLSPDFLSGLRACSNLSSITLGGIDYPADRWMEDLRRLHSLVYLRLESVPLTAQQLHKIFTICPRMKGILLVGDIYKNIIESGEFKNDTKVRFQHQI